MKKAKSERRREPSRSSLREMPEIDFKSAKVRPNPYAARIAAEGFSVQVGRGRPKKGDETGPTVPRSIRFPTKVWKQLEKRAAAEGLPLHAAIRTAVLSWANQRGERPEGRPKTSSKLTPGQQFDLEMDALLRVAKFRVPAKIDKSVLMGDAALRRRLRRQH